MTEDQHPDSTDDPDVLDELWQQVAATMLKHLKEYGADVKASYLAACASFLRDNGVTVSREERLQPQRPFEKLKGLELPFPTPDAEH